MFSANFCVALAIVDVVSLRRGGERPRGVESLLLPQFKQSEQRVPTVVVLSISPSTTASAVSPSPSGGHEILIAIDGGGVCGADEESAEQQIVVRLRVGAAPGGSPVQ